ncbi:MAG: toxin, partial [Chloroflexota bacterium]|nr:toxin [Chloroflexota bacterium]
MDNRPGHGSSDGNSGSDGSSGTGGAGGSERSSAGRSGPAWAAPPYVSLPRGGGAVRGIDEKFSVNPANGTATLAVPIGTSPGRGGSAPQLSISYDSGSGNGPFGLGWHLSIPSVTRKTDKGLPRYSDGEGSDVFILSSAEDLVPVLNGAEGTWQRVTTRRTVGGTDYEVEAYRPRIEGLFARIERWHNTATGDTHWRSISKDNVTTLYGSSSESRIADPEDPSRVFTWLICESYDDKGNASLYQYQSEDEKRVDLAQASEANRTGKSRSANRYLKRIKYGNPTPREPGEDLTQRTDWLFEVVCDYGEHDADAPAPEAAREWLCRHDPFSSYRAGFEVRTYRLCQRILMFHHFPAEQGIGRDCLVRSTDFTYQSLRDNPDDLRQGHPVASKIASIGQTRYKRTDAGSYLKASLPPLEFEYSEADIQNEVREVDAGSLEN